MEKLTIEEKYAKLIKQRTSAVIRWQQKNKDKVSGYQKTYIEKNKNKLIKTATEYNKSNKDKYKEYQSNYRQTKLLRKLPFYDGNDNHQGDSDSIYS
jgi:hypothetical protein